MGSIGTAALLDVETTGFSAYADEIIELPITAFRYDRVKGQRLEVISEYSALREPSCRISRAASEVHGITRRMVRGHELDLRQIRAMLRQSDFIVAHCAAFDRSFLGRLIPSSRNKLWLCSRDGIDWFAKGFESRSLEDLARAHAIKNLRAHRAGGDVATLLDLLSHKSCRRTYFHELLRNAGLIRPQRHKA